MKLPVVSKTIFIIVIALPYSWANAAELPPPVDFVIKGHRIPSDAYSLYVREIGRQDPVLAVNPDTPFNPASVIKIIPTLAALELLGPAYRWKTEVYTLGNISNGVLHGDLLFKGYGDPHLVIEDFRKILEELRRRGIRDITGDLLIDASWFSIAYEDPGAFDNDPYRTYNVLPNAFLVNFKAVYFHFYPGPDGRNVMVHPEPELAGLKIDNRLRLRKRYCGGFQRGVAVTVPDSKAADQVIFSGRFPSGCSHYILSRSLLTHETYAYGAFKSIWRQLGGTIAGQVRTAAAPVTGKPFLVHHSKPLSDIIRLINKFSNNVMTRQLLLTLGAELHEPPGTVGKGVRAIEDYLTGLGLDTQALNIDNGSGLSRDARIPAKLLADILEHAWTIPYRPEFISSLAITGVDGTAKYRLRHKAASGYAHVKTGSIDDVSAVAGYVHGRSGREYVVAGMMNRKLAHKGHGKELMNALVAWAHNL
ncbi:MAG: D-alanyl-D-alanine carboxypeptidase/D-alanyl-D-alanine-endopeptidase [Gammaproteobacteria bacterium]|nr:D-alanyl-D-alanine carboxypeptidase/D-alanyl-D-alanine-endopeptidase [Gammaproteobacteria bacterium]